MKFNNEKHLPVGVFVTIGNLLENDICGSEKMTWYSFDCQFDSIDTIMGYEIGYREI